MGLFDCKPVVAKVGGSKKSKSVAIDSRGDCGSKTVNKYIKKIDDGGSQSIDEKVLKEKEKFIKYCSKAFKEFDWSGIRLDSRQPASYSVNKQLYQDFSIKYPNICFSTGEFLYLCKYQSAEDLEKMFCPECGKRTNYTRPSHGGYSTFCSQKCASNSYITKEKTKNTNLERFGVENPNQCKEVREKFRQTCLENWGVEHPSQSEEIKRKKEETCREHWGVDNPSQSVEIQEKRKNTFLTNFGVENPSYSEDVIQKIQETNLERFGVRWSQQNEQVREKSRQSCKEHLGVEYPMQSEEVREKSKQSCKEHWGVEYALQSEECKEKVRQTNRSRYGKDYYAQTEEGKQKVLEGKRRNGTFNTSKPEEELFLELKKYFPKVLRQYVDEERYPFACDFYIPINDMFIELNASWTHGEGLGAFDKSNKEHRKKLCRWKEKAKTSSFYKNALEVWTVRDPLKLKTFESNDLNYKIFLSLGEAKEWLGNLKDKTYYKNFEFKKNKFNKLWSDKDVRRDVVQWCRDIFGLGLGEIRKNHIIKALKALY